jgi:hypothetical protein
VPHDVLRIPDINGKAFQEINRDSSDVRLGPSLAEVNGWDSYAQAAIVDYLLIRSITSVERRGFQIVRVTSDLDLSVQEGTFPLVVDHDLIPA